MVIDGKTKGYNVSGISPDIRSLVGYFLEAQIMFEMSYGKFNIDDARFIINRKLEKDLLMELSHIHRNYEVPQFKSTFSIFGIAVEVDDSFSQFDCELHAPIDGIDMSYEFDVPYNPEQKTKKKKKQSNEQMATLSELFEGYDEIPPPPPPPPDKPCRDVTMR